MSNLEKGCQHHVVKGSQNPCDVDGRNKKADGLVLRSVILLAMIGTTSQREDKGEVQEKNDGSFDGRWIVTPGFQISPETSTEPVHRSTH